MLAIRWYARRGDRDEQIVRGQRYGSSGRGCGLGETDGLVQPSNVYKQHPTGMSTPLFKKLKKSSSRTTLPPSSPGGQSDVSFGPDSSFSSVGGDLSFDLADVDDVDDSPAAAIAAARAARAKKKKSGAASSSSSGKAKAKSKLSFGGDDEEDVRAHLTPTILSSSHPRQDRLADGSIYAGSFACSGSLLFVFRTQEVCSLACHRVPRPSDELSPRVHKHPLLLLLIRLPLGTQSVYSLTPLESDGR